MPVTREWVVRHWKGCMGPSNVTITKNGISHQTFADTSLKLVQSKPNIDFGESIYVFMLFVNTIILV